MVHACDCRRIPVWQCPGGLYLHFYINGVYRIRSRNCGCVNALAGFTCISTIQDVAKYASEIADVSMPCRALPAFLRKNSQRLSGNYDIVSMPCRALPAFLHLILLLFRIHLQSVSMPCRALPAFLPCLTVARINTGLLKAFLHIIIRIF